MYDTCMANCNVQIIFVIFQGTMICGWDKKVSKMLCIIVRTEYKSEETASYDRNNVEWAVRPQFYQSVKARHYITIM